MRAWWAQTRAEVAMTLRRGETLLLTLIIPVLLLVFLTLVHVTAHPAHRRIDFFAPSILALTVLSTSLVALSISTGFERTYGILRRLHVTPLGRARLIGAKIAALLVTEALQVAVVAAVAVGLGWRPHGGPGGALAAGAAMLLASAGLAGIGLALAGWLRAEVNLAAANGLYLVLLLGSGIVVPLSSLPAAASRVATALPAGALAEALHRIVGQGGAPTGADWLVLALWAIGAPALAARSFRLD